MGLFGFIKSQFIEVIEWTDMKPNELVYRFPVENKEIKMGAQLTVREGQVAIFVNEGQIADVYSPGRHELATENMPILTKLKSWKYGFNSPFKAEVYFISTRQFTDQKWGTTNPVMMRDQDFGMLRIRAFGVYSFKVNEPTIFLKEVFGTSASFSTEEITSHMKAKIISQLSDLLAESNIPALDFSRYYEELSHQGIEKLKMPFNQFGLEIKTFAIENISLPPEVEEAMDKRTSMGVLGNMQQYAQYQAAEAMRDAANNPGGNMASAGVGMGAGMAMGQMFNQNFNQPQSQKKQCPHCQSEIDASAKFCPSCGKETIIEKVPCPHCQYMNEKDAKFCSGCGQALGNKICSNCQAEVENSAKFCPKCGKEV
ncbi:MAG: SPFH domain-containing protein [Clostridia bacterium]|nr:SPFH domain-containing protein [Clostridia bacterium]